MYVCVLSHLSCVQLFVPCGLQPSRLLCPLDSSGKNTEVSCHFLLQRIFLIHELKLGLLHGRQILYQLSYKESSCSLILP